MTQERSAPRYYKATRPDGTDFRTGSIDYAAALESGEPLVHGAKKLYPNDPATYFSVATVPTDCTGMRWPCRLFAVEPHECRPRKRADGGDPNKRALRALRVVEELPAHEVFGPQGEEVVAILERAERLTAEEAEGLAAWGAARGVAWGAARGVFVRGTARGAAWDAAWGVVRGAARAAVMDATLATLTRDLIGKSGYTQEHHDLLMKPWKEVIGDE